MEFWDNMTSHRILGADQLNTSQGVIMSYVIALVVAILISLIVEAVIPSTIEPVAIEVMTVDAGSEWYSAELQWQAEYRNGLAKFDECYAALESSTSYSIDKCGSSIRRTTVRRSDGRIARSATTDSFRIRTIKAHRAILMELHNVDYYIF